MRSLFLILSIVSALHIQGFGQDISVAVDTLSGKYRKERYSYQSIDQYDQRFLIKLGATGGSQSSFGDNGRSLPFDLFAFEYKLAEKWSVEGTYYFQSGDIFFNAVSVRLRRYLNRNNMANNLSGKYLALEYSDVLSELQTFDPYLGSSQAVFLQFGNQIKKSRYGYADFQLFTSYQFGLFGNSLNLGFNVVLGTAWGPLGQRSPLVSTTPFVNQHEHTLITIESPTLVIGEGFDAFSFSSSIEQEIFIKGLTSRTQLSVGYSRQVSSGFLLESFGFSVSEEVRKYFGPLKKRSADRPVHSFSGIYAGAGLNNTLSFRQIDLIQGDETEDIRELGSDRITPNLAFGYQERLGKRFFFDIFARYSFFTRNDFYENTKGEGAVYFGTRVGLNWGW